MNLLFITINTNASGGYLGGNGFAVCTSSAFGLDQHIISNNVLLGIGRALYESGTDIKLNANFEVQLGVEFDARIKHCIPE